MKRYWMGRVGPTDDFGVEIGDTFYDAATVHGPWAIMTPQAFAEHGRGSVGTGIGQKYVKQEDGRWLKVEG